MSQEIQVSYDRLKNLILTLQPCRERSLAITKLQEVKFWVDEGIKVTSEKKEDTK
jgi:hypothetical protein